MLSPPQAAVLLLMAILAAGFDAGSRPAMADPVAASREAPAVPPRMGRASTAPDDSSTAPAISARTAAPAGQPPSATPPDSHPRGRVYLFRGFLGEIFSGGMDRLGQQIEDAGITASVNAFWRCGSVADEAIREYRRDPAPITLIGHSAGGYCAMDFAAKLQAEAIPVSLIIAIDPAHTCPKLPLNVERFINIFQSNSYLGGGDIKPEDGYAGHYAVFDLREHREVVHINMDKLDVIHQPLIRKIQQLAMTPAKAQGEAVPIRVVVPVDAALELWDSGMPVFARPGDTLQTLATSYHVPLWSLVQINRKPETTPLALGERIIVPRYLVPLTAVSTQLPPKR